VNQNKYIMKNQITLTKQLVSKFFSFLGLLMFFLLFSNPIYAQGKERIVTGVINSLDGSLFSASIVLKGTATGAVSNEKGEFTFPEELKVNDVLVISYLGYESQEVTITNNTTFIEPFLEDISIVIVAAMRTKKSSTASIKNLN